MVNIFQVDKVEPAFDGSKSGPKKPPTTVAVVL